MIRWLLKKFGYYHMNYGFACGRHWLSIDGRIIAQTPGDIWLRDEDCHRLGYIFLDHGKHWTRPDSLGNESGDHS